MHFIPPVRCDKRFVKLSRFIFGDFASNCFSYLHLSVKNSERIPVFEKKREVLKICPLKFLFARPYPRNSYLGIDDKFY